MLQPILNRLRVMVCIIQKGAFYIKSKHLFYQSFILFFVLMTLGIDCKKNPLNFPIIPIDSTFGLTHIMWSRDNSKFLVLASVMYREGYDWYVVDTTGGRAKMLYRDTLAKINPSISPDGKKIVYLAAELGREFSRAHVWVIDTNGTNAKDLTPFGGNWEHVRWAPDSKRVVFNGDIEDSGEIHTQIVLADVETGEYKLLTTGKYTNYDPYFLRDNKTIVYFSGKIHTTYGGKVFFMKDDGTNQVPIDTSAKASAYPNPSPTRNEMFFTWGFGGESDDGMYVVNYDTVSFPANPTSFHRIWPYSGGSGDEMKWSPDGNLLVYPKGVTKSDLFLTDRDGKNEKRLTYGFNITVYPNMWSNDGKKIVFTSYNFVHEDSSGIYVCNLEDFSLKKIKITR